jgi:hypothetical protein
MAQGPTARSSDVRAQRFAIPARRTMQEQTHQRRASRPAPQALLYRSRTSPAPGRAQIRPTHRHIDLANVVVDRKRRGTEQLVRLRTPPAMYAATDARRTIGGRTHWRCTAAVRRLAALSWDVTAPASFFKPARADSSSSREAITTETQENETPLARRSLSQNGYRHTAQTVLDIARSSE